MWQQVYENHRGEGFEVVAVACDVQGAKAAAPWVEKANATFPVLLDSDNRLAAMFGFDFIPLTIWLDETGKVVRGPKGADIRRDDQRQRLVEWIKTGQVVRDGGKGSRLTESQLDARLRVQFAAQLLSSGEKEQALVQLKKALTGDPKNWLIRKQIWAIQHPERFYKGPVDYTWQREQLQRDRTSESAEGPSSKSP